MWTMLQQEYPDDYIIASGEAHSLRQFIQLVFARLNLDWAEHIMIDEKLYRPADIAVIYGDVSKARQKLGWRSRLSFQELIGRLVDAELAEAMARPSASNIE